MRRPTLEEMLAETVEHAKVRDALENIARTDPYLRLSLWIEPILRSLGQYTQHRPPVEDHGYC